MMMEFLSLKCWFLGVSHSWKIVRQEGSHFEKEIIHDRELAEFRNHGCSTAHFNLKMIEFQHFNLIESQFSLHQQNKTDKCVE